MSSSTSTNSSNPNVIGRVPSVNFDYISDTTTNYNNTDDTAQRNYKRQITDHNAEETDIATHDTREHHHHHHDDGDDNDSHFSDIASAAARAMEHIDMDKLCSELFSSEYIYNDVIMLEEAVQEAATCTTTAATGYNELSTADGNYQGGVDNINPDAIVRGGMNNMSSGFDEEFGGGGGGNDVSVSAEGIEGSSPTYTTLMGRINVDVGCNKTGNVTDCASSTDGSEVTVPISIDVPSGVGNNKKLLEPRPSCDIPKSSPSAAMNNKSPQLLFNQGQQQAKPQPLGSPASLLQFSNQATKKQRLNHGGCQVSSSSSSHQVNPITPSYGFSGNPVNGFALKSPPSVPNNNNKIATTPLPPAGVLSTNVNTASIQQEYHSIEGDVLCVKCQFPGADVRFNCDGGGGGGCAYHARCLDLNSLCQEVKNPPSSSKDGDTSTATNSTDDTTKEETSPSGGGGASSSSSSSKLTVIDKCPCCHSSSRGMEILPLSFTEMDRIQQTTKDALGIKRPHTDMVMLPTTIPSHSGAQPRRTVQCYDPSQPRTGRWTDEEILFRDTLISYFLSGSLPLSNGLKLNDFLPQMLKSKQSRLAKKMKHAKLSTKYFYPKSGCVIDVGQAKELSRLEMDFVCSIPDPVERSEVTFHMRREWRDHFATRCHALGLAFDASQWLSSVEDMEHRLAFEKERHRLAKRRFMMGKALEKDVGEGKLEKGVFVNSSHDGKEEFELAVEKSISNSARVGSGGHRPRSRGNSLSHQGVKDMKDQGSSTKESKSVTWSSNDPNFKTAAPFLAGIASYIERNGVPFEHVDVWVPSYVDGPSSSSSSPENGDFRLCFGGSVTMGVQIEQSSSSSTTNPSSSCTPLSSEDKTNFSLFGDYSAKFSFSSGCGLPGRIFKSGIPAWEQFVSNAHPSLFERRGGASQFGIKTALGMPVDSPSVGRVVLVLYSKFDRRKDEALVGRMACDLKLLCPAPRWKLVVDMDTTPSCQGGAPSSLQASPVVNTSAACGFNARSSPILSGSAPPMAPLRRASSGGSSMTYPSAVNSSDSEKERQIKSLILLLASNIPSDMNSPLGQQLQGIMSLRLLLLRGNRRTPEEEHLIDTVLVLYESYKTAGRGETDIAVMVARDFTFHLGHNENLRRQFGCPPPGQAANSPQMPSQVPAPNMHAMAAAARAQSLMGPMMGPAGMHLQGPNSLMMGSNNNMMNFHQRSQYMAEFYKQNSSGGFLGNSPRSATSS